jgi:glycosyltransferase involved in cell wall biosynthesis
VGGTHPALLEAMAMGNCVVVNGTAENLETIGDAGLSYDAPDDASAVSALAKVLQALVDDPGMVDSYRRKAQRRAKSEYTWNSVTDRYERLFLRTGGKPRRHRGGRSAEGEAASSPPVATFRP